MSQVIDLDSLFGDLFAQANRLPDVQHTLRLTEDEAAAGVTRDVVIQRSAICTSCEGRGGATPADVIVKCARCQATGRTTIAHGFFQVATTCEACKGAGSSIANPCPACAGRGTTRVEATIAVTVPPGVQHGTTIRLENQGNLVADGTRGALFVYLVVGDREDTRADDAMAAFERMMIEPNVPRAIVRRPGGNPVLTPPLILGLVVTAVLLVLGFLR